MHAASAGAEGKGKGKGGRKTANAKGKPSLGSGLAAEQVREARESNQAKNAEGSIRDRMVDIGRGNQQAGRQRGQMNERQSVDFRGKASVDLRSGEKVVVVFGAARGIGAAIAKAFAVEGAHVAAIDRDPSVHELAQLSSAVSWPGGRRDRLLCRSPAQPKKSRNEFGPVRPRCLRRRHRFGQIRLSVLEARACRLGTRAENQLDRRGQRRTRVRPRDGGRGTLEMQRQNPTTVKARSSSRSMLFLSSVAGQIGSQTDPPYSAAKAALINFAQCAAKDLAPFGVRVNTLCPGMVQTPLNRSVYEAWAREQPESERSTYEAWTADKIKKLVPLNRWQQPEDIAAMAVFLASTQARNITGQTINVDGGYVMHW